MYIWKQALNPRREMLPRNDSWQLLLCICSCVAVPCPPQQRSPSGKGPWVAAGGSQCRRGPQSDKRAAVTGKSGRQVQVLDEQPHSPPSSISTPSLSDDASGGLGSSVIRRLDKENSSVAGRAVCPRETLGYHEGVHFRFVGV